MEKYQLRVVHRNELVKLFQNIDEKDSDECYAVSDNANVTVEEML